MAAMFTGIVEGQGRVMSFRSVDNLRMWDGSTRAGYVLKIRDLTKETTILQGVYVGCSIAVNGVCLTVIRHGDDWLKAGVAPETIRRTNLKPETLNPGDNVNLERSMAADARISGHFVQGHVDGTGVIMVRIWVEKSTRN